MYIITIRIIFSLTFRYIYSSLIERNKEQVFRKERKGETIEVRKKFFFHHLCQDFIKYIDKIKFLLNRKFNFLSFSLSQKIFVATIEKNRK